MNGPVANRILLGGGGEENEKGGTSWWHLFLPNAFKIQSVAFIFIPENPMLCNDFVNISQAKRLWFRLPEGSTLLWEVLASEWIYETTLAWLLLCHEEKDTWGRGSRWELLIEGEDADQTASGTWTLRGPSDHPEICAPGSGGKSLFLLKVLLSSEPFLLGKEVGSFFSLICSSPAPLSPPL